MEVLNKIKAEIEAFNEKRKQLIAELQKEFPALLKPLFERHTWIKIIGWSQYTPYFNDGDECVFSVHNEDIDVNGEDYWDANLNKQQKADVEEFCEVLKSIPDYFYKDLFGDHVQVTIYADGRIETEEYEHD